MKSSHYELQSKNFSFAGVTLGRGGFESDHVEARIFFNDQKAVAEDYSALGAKPIGGSLTPDVCTDFEWSRND